MTTTLTLTSPRSAPALLSSWSMVDPADGEFSDVPIDDNGNESTPNTPHATPSDTSTVWPSVGSSPYEPSTRTSSPTSPVHEATHATPQSPRRERTLLQTPTPTPTLLTRLLGLASGRRSASSDTSSSPSRSLRDGTSPSPLSFCSSSSPPPVNSSTCNLTSSCNLTTERPERHERRDMKIIGLPHPISARNRRPYADLLADCAINKECYASANEKLLVLAVVNDGLEREIKHLRGDVEVLGRELCGAQQRERNAAPLVRELEMIKEEREAQDEEMEGLRCALNAKTDALESKDAEISTLKTKLRERDVQDEEAHRLRELLAEKDAEIESKDISISQLKHQLREDRDAHQTALQRQQWEIWCRWSDIDCLKDEVRNLRAESESKRNHIVQLEERCALAKADVACKSAQLSANEVVVKELHEKMSAQEDEIDELLRRERALEEELLKVRALAGVRGEMLVEQRVEAGGNGAVLVNVAGGGSVRM